MTFYCTYCSKNKNNDNNLIPAHLRYSSKRIRWLYEKSINDGNKLLILSGKYGIITAEEPIKYYDQLLLEKHIKKHSKLIEDQLSKLKISKIIFFHQPIFSDLYLSNYIKCISMACSNKKIDIILEEITKSFD